jgi:hypothetical protein
LESPRKKGKVTKSGHGGDLEFSAVATGIVPIIRLANIVKTQIANSPEVINLVSYMTIMYYIIYLLGAGI